MGKTVQQKSTRELSSIHTSICQRNLKNEKQSCQVFQTASVYQRLRFVRDHPAEDHYFVTG
ncbi:MAG: hypothetical protein ABFD58_07480 [Anaerolineaceae bacterium]